MKWITVTFAVCLCFILTLWFPKQMAENKFLDQIASHEIVSILVVILTVTMASVANIHLSLSRLKSTMAKQGVDIGQLIEVARRELSSNAWMLFSLFCILLILLFLKGTSPTEIWIAAVHSGVIVIVVFNMVVLYDIYSSIYELTSFEIDPAAHLGQAGEDGSEINTAPNSET